MTTLVLTSGLLVLVVVNFVTLATCLWVLGDAQADLDALRTRQIGNGRLAEARGSVRREALRLAEVCVFSVVTWLLLARSATLGGGVVSTWAAGVLALFAAGQLLVAANSTLDKKLRKAGLRRHLP
jgi:hypothetical protein